MDGETKQIDPSKQYYSFIPSYDDAVAIHEQLTERFQDGSMLMDDGDALRYVLVYVIAVIFFWLNTNFFWKMFEYFKVKQFVQRSYNDKVFYTCNFSGCVHHLFVAVYSWYLIHNSCQNHEGYPEPSEQGGSLSSSGLKYGWFRNEVCMMELNKGYVYNVIISMAYMTVDYAILKLWIERLTVLQQQTIIHHILAIGGFGSAILGGFGMPGISNASLLCEFSNIFLSLKETFTKDTRNSFWGVVVQLLFFVSYTLFRFVMFPFLAYRTITVTILSWTYIGWFRKICMIWCVIQAHLVTLLNLYWYMLILKGLRRLLQTIGVLKKSANDNSSYDDVDKYEASAHTELIVEQKNAAINNEGGQKEGLESQKVREDREEKKNC